MLRGNLASCSSTGACHYYHEWPNNGVACGIKSFMSVKEYAYDKKKQKNMLAARELSCHWDFDRIRFSLSCPYSHHCESLLCFKARKETSC